MGRIPALSFWVGRVMSVSQYILDASRENFQEMVLQNSHKGPVLVNYWTVKAGPCLRLWPILEQLANEYQGKFLLVNINTDEESALARECGVNSVPTVKLFLNEQVVEQVHGVESASSFKQMIDKYVSRQSDKDLASAVEHYQKGNPEQCFDSCNQLLILDPENPRILTTYAKLLMRDQHYQKAHDILEKYMADDATEEMMFLSANALMLATAEVSPSTEELTRILESDEKNIEAQFQRGCYFVLETDFIEALDHFLLAYSIDKTFKNNTIAKCMHAVFVMLNDEKVIKTYRQKMMDV